MGIVLELQLYPRWRHAQQVAGFDGTQGQAQTSSPGGVIGIHASPASGRFSGGGNATLGRFAGGVLPSDNDSNPLVDSRRALYRFLSAFAASSMLPVAWPHLLPVSFASRLDESRLL